MHLLHSRILSQHSLLSSLWITFIWANTMRNYQSSGSHRNRRCQISKPTRKTSRFSLRIIVSRWLLTWVRIRFLHREWCTKDSNKWETWTNHNHCNNNSNNSNNNSPNLKWLNSIIRIFMPLNNRTTPCRAIPNKWTCLSSPRNRCKMRISSILAGSIYKLIMTRNSKLLADS